MGKINLPTLTRPTIKQSRLYISFYFMVAEKTLGPNPIIGLGARLPPPPYGQKRLGLAREKGPCKLWTTTKEEIVGDLIRHTIIPVGLGCVFTRSVPFGSIWIGSALARLGCVFTRSVLFGSIWIGSTLARFSWIALGLDAMVNCANSVLVPEWLYFPNSLNFILKWLKSWKVTKTFWYSVTSCF